MIIPANVRFIGDTGDARGCSPDSCNPPSGAFEDCTSLHSTIFLGDAPTTFDENTFANTAPDFTIYHLSSSTGFTAPTWNGYHTVMLDEATYPAAPWLVSHGFPQDTDLNQDLNGDGIDLLMAYALDLDPTQDLSGSLPRPILDGNGLSLNFYAGASGVTYIAETSTDLVNWTTENVITSPPDLQNRSMASVPLDGPRRFLRLVVSETPAL